MARRLRVPLSSSLQAGEVQLDPEAARYVTRVHRLGPGDRLVAFDPASGAEAEAEVVSVARRAVRVRLESPRSALVRAPRPVTLLQGLARGEKLDAIVRDATELGATRIVPVYTARSLARPGVDAARVTRWRRVAVEAARQCGRGEAPCVRPPLPLELALDEEAPPPGSAAYCLHPPAPRALASAQDELARAASVFWLIGPEGGLTEEEVACAREAGFEAVTLGPLVLRTETVCAAVLGAALVLAGPGIAR